MKRYFYDLPAFLHYIHIYHLFMATTAVSAVISAMTRHKSCDILFGHLSSNQPCHNKAGGCLHNLPQSIINHLLDLLSASWSSNGVLIHLSCSISIYLYLSNLLYSCSLLSAQVRVQSTPCWLRPDHQLSPWRSGPDFTR